LVNGRLQSRSWEQEGVKRSKVEVNASDVTFLGGAQGSSGSGGGEYSQAAPAGSDQEPQAAAKAPPKPAKKAAAVIEEIGDEPINLDDIPF
jgi:single-stranded DNA-binding protein